MHEISSQPTRPTKKNLNEINEQFFMSDEIKAQVEATIVCLENIVLNQSALDNLWLSVKQLLLDELDTLPDLPKSNQKKQNKNFRKSQPFWNNNIEDAWKEVCRSEKVYLKCKASFHCNLGQKQQFRQSLKMLRKSLIGNFDIISENTKLRNLMI